MSNPAVEAIKRLQERNAEEMKDVEIEMDEAFKVANRLRERYDELNRMDDDYQRAINALEGAFTPIEGPTEESVVVEVGPEYFGDSVNRDADDDYDMPQPDQGLRFKKVKD